MPSRAMAEKVQQRLLADPNFEGFEIMLGSAQPIDPKGEGAFAINLL